MALTKKQKDAFASLSEAIKNSAEGFVFATAAVVKPFVAAGLVETNETITNDAGQIAVRLTDASQAVEAVMTEVAVKSPFVIEEGIPVPPASGRGRGGNSYPFELLEVGQSFFVPNTEAKPNAAKSLASTVSSATARYAEPRADGATKVNRKGETVPVMVETRKFVVRAVEGGARVWRTHCAKK